jgi:molybdopterin molybdotransferase
MSRFDNLDLSVDDARARMLACVSPQQLGAPERVALDRFAAGRVLAEPIAATRDQPPFDASAMDGYAIRLGDPADVFQVVGESAAGRPYDGQPALGQAVRIFTGAAVPPDCAVLIQENAKRDGDKVCFTIERPVDAANVRKQAGDFGAGQVLLSVGVRLNAWRLALAAAAGRAHALVARRPRVAILSTGEELVRPGTAPPSAGQIFDSNGPSLATLVHAWGGEPISLDPAHDDPSAIAATVAAVEADLILTVGGASVGDYDLVKPALRNLGLELFVERVKLRPGRPTWFGTLEDGRRVLGLPGNPASALVAAELFLRPLLAAWSGADASLPMAWAQLAAPLSKTGPREHWMRAALQSRPDGVQAVAAFPDQDSSLVRVFSNADALLRRPAGAPAFEAGAPVEILPLTRL